MRYNQPLWIKRSLKTKNLACSPAMNSAHSDSHKLSMSSHRIGYVQTNKNDIKPTKYTSMMPT